jgi:hypothetical protein
MGSSKQSDAKPTTLTSVPRERILESEVSWIGGLLLFFCTVYSLLKFDILWVFFGITALSLYILPIVSFRDPFRALPWEMTLLLAAPLLLHISAQSQSLNAHLSWWDNLSDIAFAFSISTIGFLLTIELQMYTKLRINRPLAVFFVIMFTLAVAGFWQIGEFTGDKVYGTHYQGDNNDVMMSLTWNLVGGIIMGFVYALYLRAMPEKRRTTLGLMHIYEVPKW